MEILDPLLSALKNPESTSKLNGRKPNFSAVESKVFVHINAKVPEKQKRQWLKLLDSFQNQIYTVKIYLFIWGKKTLMPHI